MMGQGRLRSPRRDFPWGHGSPQMEAGNQRNVEPLEPLESMKHAGVNGFVQVDHRWVGLKWF